MHLICGRAGVVDGVDAAARRTLEELPTLVEMEIYGGFAPGAEVAATSDIKSDLGWVLLAGAEDEVQRDYEEVLRVQPELVRFRDG